MTSYFVFFCVIVLFISANFVNLQLVVEEDKYTHTFDNTSGQAGTLHAVELL